MILRPPRAPLFPYTPLFRSVEARPGREAALNLAELTAPSSKRDEPPPGRRPAPSRWRIDVARIAVDRSEEHTSELQSHVKLVCRLLLEKKNKLNHQAPRSNN